MTLINPPAVLEITLPREGMALDEFLRRQDEQPFELIDGEEILIMTPKMFGSDYDAHFVQRILERATQGDVFIEATFILPDTLNSNWVKGSRQPDIMYLAEGRLAAYRAAHPDWRIKPLMLVPDLAVEIVSPTDRLPKVWRKAIVYLEDGVRLVWVINPMRQMVTIFAQDEAPITLYAADTLNGGDVLPGFSLALNTLFES